MDCSTLRDDMLDVLYGEANPAKVRRVEEHHARCPSCRDDMAALRGLRRTLAEWSLPESGRPQRRRIGPWGRGLAAAAVILLALGGALWLSGSELRYENGRVAFRVGRGEGGTRALLAAQEARHREEMQALKASLGGLGPRDDGVLLRKVQDLIRESEARQAVVWRASLDELGELGEARRRYDLARVSAGLSYLDGKTGQQVARATELMGYVLQASEKR